MIHVLQIISLHVYQLLTTAGDDYEMASFVLIFDANNRGPICNSVVVTDDGVHEFEEELTFNLTTLDESVVLMPAGGVLIIEDDDGEKIASDIILPVHQTCLIISCRDYVRLESSFI